MPGELNNLSVLDSTSFLARGTDWGCRYGGYNQAMIDQFVVMGFDLDRVVDAFDYVGIDRNGGEEYTLEEAYMGDITARLLGEP